MTPLTLQTKPRTRFACDALREMAQQLGPKAQLPTVVKLREELGVSMNTLHAALKELEKEGVLRRVHGVGIYVREQRTLTGKIGILLHSSNTGYLGNAYSQQYFSGIHQTAQKLGLEVLLIDDNEALAMQNVDGVIFNCDPLEIYAMGFDPQNPHILMFQHAADMASITPDDFKGAVLAVNHLKENGHQRIACLMEDLQPVPAERMSGYKHAMQINHLAAPTDWLYIAPKLEREQEITYLEWGRHHMQQWLQQGWRDLGCTAIVMQNDISAIGAMQALQESGLRIPQDVSIIGFDGTNICDLVNPQLTSVQMPLFKVGQQAVKVLYEQIHNGKVNPRNVSLEVSLRPGKSVAKI